MGPSDQSLVFISIYGVIVVSHLCTHFLPYILIFGYSRLGRILADRFTVIVLNRVRNHRVPHDMIQPDSWPAIQRFSNNLYIRLDNPMTIHQDICRTVNTKWLRNVKCWISVFIHGQNWVFLLFVFGLFTSVQVSFIHLWSSTSRSREICLEHLYRTILSRCLATVYRFS